MSVELGAEEIYAAYDMSANSSADYGVAVLYAVRGASLANARALKRKDRLTAIALAWLASTMILIGVLNLASARLLP